MVKFTKPGRLIAQTSYLGRFKPLKMFGKSSKKIVKVYRRILDLAHCEPHIATFIVTKYFPTNVFENRYSMLVSDNLYTVSVTNILLCNKYFLVKYFHMIVCFRTLI